ncbi:C39 family peptidase [Fusibacter ferrireducens]|uniref:C39 family peptidase n=1 Tax=Fusibacter ferrireducens TaxID=2785058 RepID=A0ABR9ZXJ4_9FIRM|nr:C39 family peptidase [Fusibacter ferrireducens]MBF4695188.1 C39 family peptidase [Fusibacter ferrireducens]
MGKNLLVGNLSKGTCEHLKLEAHQLLLEDHQNHGIYESEVIEVTPFTSLVMSWCSKTHENTSVEIWIKIRTEGRWSSWFSYGKWSDQGNNTGSFSGQKDILATLDVDLLLVNRGHADACAVRVELFRKDVEIPTPLFENYYIAFKPYESSDKAPFVDQTVDISLKVQAYSQLDIPEIGNKICSPTCVAMVMAYYGLEKQITDTAKGVMDNGTGIYGNWSYNVAYANERGFKSYVERLENLHEISLYLKEGIPLIASIKVKELEALHGVYQTYPSGHLVVITGLFYKDGKYYFRVNDPAASTSDKVPRVYLVEEFLNVWNGIVYVIKR